jgi:hypothetical protein
MKDDSHGFSEDRSIRSVDSSGEESDKTRIHQDSALGLDASVGQEVGTDDSAGTSELGFNLTRRTLLHSLGIAGLGVGAAVPDADIEKFQTEQREDFDPSSVQWTARDRTFAAWDTQSDGNIEKVISPYEDNDKSLNEIDRSEISIIFTSHTILKYLNVEWDDFGNPDPSLDVDGAWKHTFSISSYGLWLVNLGSLPGNSDMEDLWIVVPGPADEPFLSQDVIEYLRELGYVLTGLIDPGEVENFGYPGPNARSLLEIAPDIDSDKIAISVRRDRDLFNVLNPTKFRQALHGVSQRSINTEEDIVDYQQERRMKSSFRNLTSHTYATDGDLFSEITNTNSSNIAALQNEIAIQEKERSLASGTLSLGLGMAGLATTVLSAPLLGPIGLALGVAGVGIGFLSTVPELLEAVFDPPEQRVPPHEGFFIQLPEDAKGPTAGHSTIFDIYMSPSVSSSDSPLSANFSVRSQYGLKFANWISNPKDHLSIWKLQLESRPHPDNRKTDASDTYSAFPLPFDNPDVDPERGRDAERKIDFDDKEDLVTFRPTASFDIQLASEADILKHSNVMTVQSGSKLIFDITSTQLGHGQIGNYRLTIESFSADPAEWVPPDNTNISHELLSATDSDNNYLFDGSADVSQSVSIIQPGYYRISFEIVDTNSKKHISRRRLLVTNSQEEEPNIAQFDKRELSDGRYRFELSTSSNDSLSYLWATAPADDYRFDVDTPPQLRRIDRPDDWIYEESFSKSERYRVWVLIIDPKSGQSALQSMEYGSGDRDPDSDGDVEDVNNDGHVDETDVSALSEMLDDDPDPAKYDFDDDDDVNKDDLEALFDEVNTD